MAAARIAITIPPRNDLICPAAQQTAANFRQIAFALRFEETEGQSSRGFLAERFPLRET